MADGFETITLEKQAGIAWVTLDRPQVHNAMNLAMRDDLWSVIDAVDLDPDVFVVVFKGAGQSAFSSGADLNDFGMAPSFIEARQARQQRDLWGRLASFPKPMVAAIQGYALGAGCELALFCDFRIASPDARLGLPEAKLGYVPSAGGTQMLPRLFGLGRALDMICSGELISGEHAFDYGLVHQLESRHNLYPAAEALALRLAAMPQRALHLVKEAVISGMDQTLEQGLRLEARLRSQLR